MRSSVAFGGSVHSLSPYGREGRRGGLLRPFIVGSSWKQPPPLSPIVTIIAFLRVRTCSVLRVAVVCCLTSIVIEWAYFKDWLNVRRHFVMGQGEGGDDCENRDLHSAAINGVLSGLVTTTAGKDGPAVAPV